MAHEYPADWTESDWVVPTQRGHAVIRHGHTSPDDHSACGPTLFCCSRAARLYAKAFPETPESKASWQLIDGATIVSWIDGGVQVVYFVYCHPEKEHQLLAVGVTDPGARDVISRKVELSDFQDEANALDVLPQDDVIFRLLQDRS